MIKIVSGNILDANEKYICHQVNCRNVMGAGLAKALYTKWPRVKTDYHNNCEHRHPVDLLGTYHLVPVGNERYVVNIYGQLNYGRYKVVYTHYEALRHAFENMAKDLEGDFAFPYGFGCGLANGDWNIIYNLIEECFHDRNVTIYKYDKTVK